MKTCLHVLPTHRRFAALIFAVLFQVAGTAGAVESDRTHAAYDTVLKRFVAEGRVDYRGLKGDGAALDRCLDGLAGVAQATFGAWAQSERLAFLINLYNAATLTLILDHQRTAVS